MAVVNNTNQNYTLYYNILEYFKTIMNNHPGLSTVSQGDISRLDMFEFPDYPLGNVLITDAVFGLNNTDFTIQLTVADKIKNKNNESSDPYNKQIIPYFGTDDTVDIHANTLAILNDLISYTQRSQTAFEINEDITVTPFAEQFNNGLAGWVSTFVLRTHNNKNMCLFDLNPQTTTTTTEGPKYYYEAGKYNCVAGNCVFVELLNIKNTNNVTANSGYYLDPITGFIYEVLDSTVSGSYVLTGLSGTGSLVCNNVICTTTTTSTTTTSTTTTTTAAPTTTTSTTTAGPTTTTTTAGICSNSEFAVLQSNGNSSWATEAAACAALTGSLSTVFGNLWISGSNLASGCVNTKGGQYPIWTNPSCTVGATYNPPTPYIIVLNITYGTPFTDAYVVKVDLIGGQTYFTQQDCV